MSKFSIIPARALFDTRLDQEDVLLLVVLCQYTDKSGKCWPAFETISETFSPLVGRTKAYSKASISARMDRLEAAGYVRDGGHRKNAIGGYGTKDWYVLHDGEIPAEFDRSLQAESNASVQKSPPELNTSGQETPIVSERKDPGLTINNNNSLQEVWYSELEKLTGGYMGGREELIDLHAVWQEFPDVRRHNEAIRQTTAAHSRTVRVYLKAYKTFNPDYVPPKPKPTYSRGPSRPPAPGYTPPTEAERAAFHAQLAGGT